MSTYTEALEDLEKRRCKACEGLGYRVTAYRTVENCVVCGSTGFGRGLKNYTPSNTFTLTEEKREALKRLLGPLSPYKMKNQLGLDYSDSNILMEIYHQL